MMPSGLIIANHLCLEEEKTIIGEKKIGGRKR
jgi:hypothetical protein